MQRNKNRVLVAALVAAFAGLSSVSAQTRDNKPGQQPGKKQPEKQPAPSSTPGKKDANPSATPGKQPSIDGDEKGKIDLRPKFTKGEKMTFKMEMESKSKTSMPALEDKPQEQTTKHELGLVFNVKDVTDDGTIVELTFSTVKVTQQTGKDKADKLEFDSSRPVAKDKDNPLAPGCRELANTTFKLTLDKDGNVTNMAGGSGLSSLNSLGMPGALGNLGGGLPGGLGGGASSSNSQGFADAIGSIFSVKKGSPIVKVGEKWTTSDDVDSGLIGKFRITTDSVVKSYSGDQAKIKVTGKVEQASNSPGGVSLFQVKDTFYLGDYVWDTKAGMLKSMDLDQNVTIDGGSTAGGMTMTSSSKIHVNRQR